MFKKILSFAVVVFLGLFLLSPANSTEIISCQRIELEDFLKNLELREEISYRNLTAVPIYAKKIKDMTSYLTLDEAQQNGCLIITELSGGRVPQLKIVNKSSSYVFLMAGEMLSGGKQNRLIAKDVLLGPNTREVILPVYCSEQGRWQEQSKDFSSFRMLAQPNLRNKVLSKYSQYDIWSGIKEEQSKFKISSATSSLQDVYKDENVQHQMKDYIENIETLPRLDKDMVGVAVAVGDKIIGVDIFSNPKLFSSLWPKLLRSYVSSCLYVGEGNSKGMQQDVKQLLNKLLKEKTKRKEALALGEEIEITSTDYTSFGLVYNGGVIHLSAFPTNENGYDKAKRIPVIE